jgi:hypothetical protein
MTANMLESVRIRPALALAVAAFAWVATHADSCLARGERRPVTTLRDAMIGSEANDGRTQSAPSVARYVSGGGDRFILDRSGPVALLRFDRGDEVWALKPTPAPGGDVIYRNDIGQQVLRATRLGGLTLFTPRQPMGEAVALVGEAPASHLPKGTITMLMQALGNATLRVGVALGRKVQVRAEGAGAEYLFADTLNVVADAITKMAALREGRPYLTAIREIHVHPARRMDVKLQHGVLDVSVLPSDGIAGRPSSGRIAQAIVSAR